MDYRITFTPHITTRLHRENTLRYDEDYKFVDRDIVKRTNEDFEIYQKSIAHRALDQIQKSRYNLQLLTSNHSTFSLKVLKSLGIDFTKQQIEANSIDQLIPSSSSIKIMHSQLKIWNNLYKNETKLLPSSMLYDKILSISKNMSNYVASTISKQDNTFHIEAYLTKISSTSSSRESVDTISTSRVDSGFKNKYLDEQVKLLASINSLVILDESLSETYFNNFYHEQLKILPRDYLVNVENDDSISKNQRYISLNFVKQICKECNFDQTTCGLTVLLFDSFIAIKNSNSDSSAADNDQALLNETANVFNQDFLDKFAVASLMLIAGLREHWADIKRDSYLENIISLYKPKFTIHEIAKCQMEIIKTMPKGFTNIYVPFEYGLFFLSVLRDIGESSNNGEIAADDGLGLDCLYSYLKKTGSISWVYNIISKWDELFLYENWNHKVPPSRAAAAIFLHIFLDFYKTEADKNLIWCRRFSSRVFKMLYDCDVGLWYHCLKTQISIVYMEIAKASESSWNTYNIFKITSFQWCTQLKLVSVYKAKSLIEYLESGQKLCGLDYMAIANILPRLVQLVIAKNDVYEQDFDNEITARVGVTSRNFNLGLEEDNTKKRRS